MLGAGCNARRWPRDRARLTALVISAGGAEHLGKTLDVSDRGLGLVLEGGAVAEYDTVQVCLVVGDAVVEQRGLVVYREPLGLAQRVGVRLGAAAPMPFEERPRARCGAGADGDPLPFGPAGVQTPGAFSVNLGTQGPLLFPEDRSRLERESQFLASELGSEPRPHGAEWESFLLRHLRDSPRSPWAAAVGTELFRLAMMSCYPVLPGNQVAGCLTFEEGEKRPVHQAPAVTIDRFAVARCDAGGRFAADGLPMAEVPTAVRLGLRHPCLRMNRDVVVSLPPKEVASVFVALPVAHARPCRCARADSLGDAFDAFCRFPGVADSSRSTAVAGLRLRG